MEALAASRYNPVLREFYQRLLKSRQVYRVNCDELGGVDWEWQSANAAMGKARWGDAVGQNPTGRGKPGTKRSIPVEASGGPMSIVVAAANVYDTKVLEETLESVVVERPALSVHRPQHLCLAKGYDNPTGHQTTLRHHYEPHIRRLGEGKFDGSGQKRYPARRWVS